jgi:signal transduction histidine kinase
MQDVQGRAMSSIGIAAIRKSVRIICFWQAIAVLFISIVLIVAVEPRPDAGAGGETEDHVRQQLISDGWANVQIAQKGQYFVATASKDGRTKDFAVITRGPNASEELSYFHVEGSGKADSNYRGPSVSEDSVARRLSLSPPRAAAANVSILSLLREFVLNFAWFIPLFLLATLGTGLLAIHSELKKIPIESAGLIASNPISFRLPPDRLPSEITPLVVAVDNALDRLEQGFARQRQFTANATHELSTSLAAITAALDTMNADSELTKLKADVSRMNRLVEQLQVTHLDALQAT